MNGGQFTLLVLHYLLVAIAAAGVLLLCFVDWRWARKPITAESQRASVQRRFLRQFHLLTIAALAAGLVTGLTLWYLYDNSPATSIKFQLAAGVRALYQERGLSLLGSLFFSFLCHAVVYQQWQTEVRRNPLQPASWPRVVLLLSATNLLYHFPLWFVMVSLLAQRGTVDETSFARANYYQLLHDGELSARLFHHWGALL